MDSKHLVWIGMAIGSAVGGYIPALWDSSLFSISGIIGSMVGGIAGIWAGYKISRII